MQRVPPNPHLPSLRKRIARAPAGPGIYRWLDGKGAVLYVGKAKNLRKRLRSYVAPGKKPAGPWKQNFLMQIADFEVTVTNTELEALIFETNQIKQYRPKYNVLMKDDKNYIYARVTVGDPFPKVEAARRIDPSDGARYFGPMATGGELWMMLTMLRKIFPFRTCRMEITPEVTEVAEVTDVTGVRNGDISAPSATSVTSITSPPNRSIPLHVTCKHKDRPTPCLDHHIGKCSAPCIGTRTPEEYGKESIEGVLSFLKGDYESVKKVLEERMRQTAAGRRFELAAQLRDHILSIERLAQGKQIITDTLGEDADVIAVALLSSRAHVCVMKRRNGRLVEDECFTLAGQAENKEEILEQFLPQYYEDGMDIPETVIVSDAVPQKGMIEEWLSRKRGRRVRVVVPARGKKSRLLRLAEKNAQEKARQEELKWEAEKRNTEAALAELKRILGLRPAPERIEGYDISHLGGTETAGSMVVMKHGKAENDQYRSFTIRTMKEGVVDDYRALREILTRRLRRLTADQTAEERRWNEKGITFGRARKAEQGEIEKIFDAYPQELMVCDMYHSDFLVARRENRIVAFARVLEHLGLQEIKSVWVHPLHQGQKLEQFLIRKLLRRVKKGKVYVTIPPGLEEYYGELGFRYVQKPPAALEKLMEQRRQEASRDIPALVMMYDAVQSKIDPSLAARPDLIVIDGGKGQLGVAVDVLQDFGLDIPVIGLAKREEEVFLPWRSEPVLFPQDSPAKFLLMRLRDEAHRFSNRLRENIGRKRATASALDGIPGIGVKAKRELLKRFGSTEGVQSASDAELREVLGPMQVQWVRRML